MAARCGVAMAAGCGVAMAVWNDAELPHGK